MKHSFTPGVLDASKCATCKYDVIAHTNMATCEACTYIGPCDIFMTMLMCPECIAKEKALQTASNNGAEDRVKSVIERAQTIDYSIKVREDIFNAQTVANVELKQAIESDTSITNKRFEYARLLAERYTHFSKVIFEREQQNNEDSNRQRAIQSELNQLASQLKVEEREKLKLQDINYKPTVTKISKPKAVTTKKGFDKVELVKWANEAGVPLAVLQMICVSKNYTPEQAFNHLKGKGLA